ncbi:MAG TPA: glycosyltransferase family A protein [Terriglobales bacterium]|nr:glycosyltransferase family A protein [Terriglobales bacterium]
MNITVILCTYNRCRTLEKALSGVAASTVPESLEWEVLVVDNNSNDQTRDVVEDFCTRYPGRFRYLFEPHQGKSYALNSGIREARGDVLAFMDDDVTVESTWLQNLTAALCSGEWAGAGGRIFPQWPCAPPSWLPEKEWYGMAPLVMFDRGPEAGPLTDPPFGTNMAFHRRLFEKYGIFRTDLGPGPNGKIRNNEDTEFGRRLLEAGERLKYEPTAVVHHSVPQNRLRRGYFLTWWFNKGRADVRETGVAADTKWFVSGIPLYLFRRLAVGILRWLVTLDPSRRFSCRLAVWLTAGTMVESYRQSREVHKRERLTCV